MHILEIPSFFPPYGGLFCLDQSKALKALGHEVRILSNVQLGMTIGWKDYLTLPWHRYEHEMDGVTVYQSYQRGIPKVIRPNVKRWVSIVMSMFEDYVNKYGKPDILHAHCAKWAGYAAMKISEQAQIPYVVTEHLPKEIFQVEFGPSVNHWQIPLLKKVYQRASNNITVSEELVDDIACYFGKDYQHTFISNIIDVDFWSYRERCSRQGRSFRFCCSALFVERKGYDILLAAFHQVSKKYPNIELLIAGQGTDSLSLRNMIDKMGGKPKVICMGPLNKEQVRQMYYDSDALVLATRGESQGLVLLEAMSTGIPAVSTEAIPKSVRVDEGIIYVPVDDVKALAGAMEKTIEHVYDGKQLSRQVAEISSPQIIGKQIEAVLRTSLHTA